jgi:hypothetical protein
MNAIPLKILLSYHQTTRARLAVASLPYGRSMTKWINDAICEKLDREQPATIGVCAVLPVEPEKPINPEKELEERKRVARKPDFFGPWTAKYSENKTWRMFAEARIKEAKRKGEVLGLEDALELVAKGEGVTMSEDEGREIMAEYHRKQLESVVPAAVVPAAVVPAAVVPAAVVPAIAQDADFWGDDDFAKGRALVKTHAR